MESLLRKQEERSNKSDSPPPSSRKLRKLTAASNICGSHSTIQEPIYFSSRCTFGSVFICKLFIPFSIVWTCPAAASISGSIDFWHIQGAAIIFPAWACKVDWMKYRLFEWANYYGWSIADSHFLLLLAQSTSIIWSSAFPADMGMYTQSPHHLIVNHHPKYTGKTSLVLLLGMLWDDQTSLLFTPESKLLSMYYKIKNVPLPKKFAFLHQRIKSRIYEFANMQFPRSRNSSLVSCIHSPKD